MSLRPVPPSPHARYRPKRTSAAGVHLHMAAHITHLKILHRVSPPVLFCREPACTGRFPLPAAPCVCIIAHAASHKSDFSRLFRGFLHKMLHPPKNGKVEHGRSGCFPALSGRRRIPAPHGRARRFLRAGLFVAVADDGLPAHDANEDAPVIHHGVQSSVRGGGFWISSMLVVTVTAL